MFSGILGSSAPVSIAAPAPVVEYITPAPAAVSVAPAPVLYAAPAPVVEYIAPAPAVIRGASTCVVE